MTHDEVFLPPTADQLEQLDSDVGLATLFKLDILRDMGPWGTMIVLRPNVPGALTEHREAQLKPKGA